MGVIFGKRRRHPSPPGNAAYPPDFDASTIALCDAVRPFTMTGPERIDALRRAIQHIVASGIAGDIVECGVWKGGSMMAIAMTLRELGDLRTLHLYDTFEGMPPPVDVDRDVFGTTASEALAHDDKATGFVWARSPLDEVKANLASTGYPTDRIRYVAGKVEDTIPAHVPERISLLRLDTDWYESTRHELEHLYPRLSPGGILIIDDYGHWQGARKAVDEYFASTERPVFLNRVDYTCRLVVKHAA